MSDIVGLIKEFLIPGTRWFLLVGLTAGVALALVPRLRRLSTGLLLVLTVLYWGISIPVVTGWLATGNLNGRSAVVDFNRDAVDAVVVLANGVHRFKVGALQIDTLGEETVFTVLEAVRVYQQVGSPLMIASGGVSRPEVFRATEADLLREAMIAHGVPSQRIVLESQSGTTLDQAVKVGAIIRSLGISRVALVTSPLHMERALSAFRTHGVPAVASPSAYGSRSSYRPHPQWRPTTAGWILGERAIYERLGNVYYRGMELAGRGAWRE